MLVGRNAGRTEKLGVDGTGWSIDPMITNEEYDSLKSLSDQETRALCQRLRHRLVEVVSKTGGHLASNLGVVELTVALHRVFDTGRDRLIFDVGHQCYVHKILTGRNGLMESIRSFGGIAGFPKPAESRHDAFIAGHASNSVSVALGMARARTRLGQDYNVIALLGDGALTGGLSYEGLSSAGQSGEPLLVILNDNGMSIAKNVGGIAEHLARQRLKPRYFRIKGWYRKVMNATPPGRAIYRFTHKLKAAIKAAMLPGSMFEDMGFQYMGPVDGHDVKELTRILQQAKSIGGPVLLHVRTVKGNGFAPAERNPDAFHGTAPFYPESGLLRNQSSKESFSSVFGDTLLDVARRVPALCAITAAMEAGTGLVPFAQEFPDRFFDVGIAEGHAVSMAAGMAKQGLLPVFAVYSTFLQRSYDMLLHDVAISRLHVVFCVDRAGFVGDDGETHHGLFDVSYLSTVPGMTILCPASHQELSSMLYQALTQVDGPVAVRYPRGSQGTYEADHSHNSAVKLIDGADITLVSYGTMIQPVLEAAEALKAAGYSPEVLKLNRIAPLDDALLAESVIKTGRLLVAEETAAGGCVGERILSRLVQRGVTVKRAALCNCGDGFVTHGTVEELRTLCGLDSDSLTQRGLEVIRHGR